MDRFLLVVVLTELSGFGCVNSDRKSFEGLKNELQRAQSTQRKTSGNRYPSTCLHAFAVRSFTPQSKVDRPIDCLEMSGKGKFDVPVDSFGTNL